MQEQRHKEIMELRVKVEHLSRMKESLEQHVNKHKMYEVRRRKSFPTFSSSLQLILLSLAIDNFCEITKQNPNILCATMCTLSVSSIH